MSAINAGSSARFTFTLTDAAGDSVPAASVQTLTLSLIDVATDANIGSWDNRDVKNVNGGTVTDGGGTIEVPASDMAMVSATAKSERKKAVLRFTTSNEAGNVTLVFVLNRVHA